MARPTNTSATYIQMCMQVTDFLTLHELRLNDNEINAFPNAMSQLVSSLNTERESSVLTNYWSESTSSSR